MPRRQRIDFRDAIQYVQVRGREGPPIFFDADILMRFRDAPRQKAPDLQRFESLIASICEECGTILHGYSLEPNSAKLVLQTTGTLLAEIMRRLCGRYSRYCSSGIAAKGSDMFASRYESKVISPEYLPHAVRRAHHSPVLAGLCRRRADYPFSSERAYIGERSPLPINTTAVKTALEQRGLFGLRGYREFMDQDETPYVENLFDRGFAQDPRIVGTKVFAQQVREASAHPAPPPSQKELIAGVARLLNVTAADIASSTHAGVRGRALVAWYGLRVGAATLTEMGRWFSVTGSTLGQAMRHHRNLSPALFSLHQLPEGQFEQSKE
jgi:putative transposase